MCMETGPSPSHCSLGAGWDAAGGWGEGGFGRQLTGKRLVAVCDGVLVTQSNSRRLAA